jgi:superfamily I DNA and/or RNA helicase/predicted DNA-binding WGR domain protein
MEAQVLTFRKFLEENIGDGNYATDDIISMVLPLFKEVLALHESDQVAPFEKEEALFIVDNCLDIDENFAHSSKSQISKVLALFEEKGAYFQVVGNMKMDIDVDKGHQSIKNLNVHFNLNEPLKYPAFIKGYQCFEQLLGHHDAQTDIFCLGLVLGSLALGLDLYDEEDLQLLANYRTNPAQYNNRIHPTISALITEMTELDRGKRTQDLYDVIHRLLHYRDYDPEKQTDLSNVAGWVNKEVKNRNQFILNKLRNRLFDTSRRNRLLYYKANMRFVNLTASSVPMVLHYQSIRPEHLFTWNSEIAGKVKGMNEIVLNKYLRFEDHQYLPSSLDKIRVESQRDVQEYGFSQLKLVIAFLNWHNLKEDPNERIQSPLLLIPVELKKNKKLKEDHYVIKVLANEAEVNPVLANYLRDLYGIKLPDFIDLDEMSLEQFYKLLKEQIDGANQGITLNYIDKPRIKIIQSVAKQTISNYKKRLRRSNGELESYKSISYSYETETYKPLGLEIFRQKIEHRSSYLEFLINEDIKINSQQLTGSTKERQLFEMVDSESNPYSWDFDVCNIVLGNFNYKKMSLVRDYNEIIDSRIQHQVFENLFSSEPKKQNEFSSNSNDLSNWYHVITADPTQTKAILNSRSGESYIIQGPPGTGKSQTITNLIADFVAQGKNVLFVCEKRAALDVVYHRLKQQGLDELCCYIHDSQSDKREFIHNLKLTYEDFVKNKMDLGDIQAKRMQLLEKMLKELDLISRFHNTNLSTHEFAGVEIRKLIARIIELKDSIIPLHAKDEETFPHYKFWLQFGNVIKELGEALEETGADSAFAEHPFSKLNENIFLTEQPNALLAELLNSGQELLKEITQVITENNVPEEFTSLQQIKDIVEDAIMLQPLIDKNNLDLLDMQKSKTIEFEKKVTGYKNLKLKYEEAKLLNLNWTNKFNEQDTSNAAEIAEKYEPSFFSFFYGAWRSLKKQVNQSYNFSAHQVKPSYRSILERLKAEYRTGKDFTEAKKEFQEQYHIPNIDITYAFIENIRLRLDDKEISFLLNHVNGDVLVNKLCKLKRILVQLDDKLEKCLSDYKTKRINVLSDDLESIQMNSELLPDLLHVLRPFATIAPEVKQAVKNISISSMQTEANMANKTFSHICRQNKAFADIDYTSIERAVEHIKSQYKQLLKLNAAYIRASIRKRFLDNLELSSIALSQLRPEQKPFKKIYNEGRKILENEFSKSMRYKSIRELSGKESGAVLKDLKPVWLMSPLSVSDSLPLNVKCFDAIIFDEASQITLEEGIPSLYRAPQTIIVGDDKQMPPSNFFTAKAEDPDDLDGFSEEEGDEILSNDADSLLAQGARKLNSVMLGWHYRSRYETLISYSNHAFYNAALLTIPDKTIHHLERIEIVANTPESAIGNSKTLFDRSISFHHMPESVYEKRNNIDEANYIANLVRELLSKNISETIGIVAFSQEQQNTIEDALTRLASNDKKFEQQLEEAYNRMEEDQFVGLFVKNLENVQGDERDIIIMSVCYGFDRKKKMIMNFGPINKKGGEKRLNVIFSRAKKHMAIISSIKHFNIKNEYNEGANYFKNFLHYAELISTGNTATARMILDGLVPDKSQRNSKPEKSIVLYQIRQALEKLGYEVTENVGQSSFKCSLGVKAKPGDEEYTLGILLDDDTHYSNDNLLEQYYKRPGILQSFGWRIINIFSKDWLQQPEKVIKQIIKRITEEPKPIEVESLEEKIIQPVSEPENQDVIKKEIQEKTINKKDQPFSPYSHLVFKRLVFKDASSHKFWEVAIEEGKLVICFGRIDTKGQTQVKTFPSKDVAEREKEKMIREKVNKGYIEQN